MTDETVSYKAGTTPDASDMQLFEAVQHKQG